ncbi:MAG: hypothetical protein J6D44_15435 [Pseudomonas sp.]|nr:hypothetical protein [Pseudomonas sp.]
MEDRELLELAAKACGFELRFRALTNMPGAEERPRIVHENGVTEKWNPLEDDGDAFRLSVKLFLSFESHNDGTAMAGDQDLSVIDKSSKDPNFNARRAIVRAAASIGEDMP